MKNLPLLALSAILMICSCTAKQEWRKQNIKNLEVKFSADTTGTDTSTINNLLHSYETFVTDFPSDTSDAEYMFMEAGIYRAFKKDPFKSVALYQKLYNNYPNYRNRPVALVMMGMVYESEIHNMEAAKSKYREFLAVYPNHPLAKDVTVLLQDLPPSAAEVFSNFGQRDTTKKATVKNTR